MLINGKPKKHNYFIYHPDAGAVKSLSSNENYHEILNMFDEETKPREYSDIADFFLFCLAGNDLKCDYFDNDCLMLKRDIFKLNADIDLNFDLSAALINLKDLINKNGYTSWYALEIFNYQDDRRVEKDQTLKSKVFENLEPDCSIFNADEMIVEMLERAKNYKKNTEFNEAIAELNKAKEIIEGRTQSDHHSDFQETIKGNLITAKVYKKDKDFLKAIELLEDAKSIIINDKSENSFNSSEIIDLLEQSKNHKKNKEYLQSIELLEQTKLKIA